MADIYTRLAAVRQRIADGVQAAARAEDSVHLLAVSKTFGAAAVRAAYAAGQPDFGEHYLQEALEKRAALADLPLSWHFIGPMQSNKPRAMADNIAKIVRAQGRDEK